MATNKHAIIRYQALDRCFSNYGRRFYIDDLIDACNRAIYDYTGIEDGVKRRQVYEDITFMESEEGFSIPLERTRDGRKVYFRYSSKDYSINKTPISVAEAEQLKNTIFMLNRFKGLPQFDWMEEVMARFKDTFKLNSNVENVVSFDQNLYLKGIEHFTGLFDAITNKQVLRVKYHPAFKEAMDYTIHPYHLKQYNNRWFLFGLYSSKRTQSIMNMAIDRIEQFEHISETYIENGTLDFSEYFDDIIGVTLPDDGKLERIILKIDISKYNYIESKPLHHSQKVKEKNRDYVIVELKLIPNYEFMTLLLGFADEVEVLEPKHVRDGIIERSKKILERNR